MKNKQKSQLNIRKKIIKYLPDLLRLKLRSRIISSQKKLTSINNFSVVTSVYNVELYLNDFFKSIINQTLDFHKHIHLIMVDDGSPDNSSTIIRKWQKKYPDNITYVKKKNGGLSSARNYGLQYVETDWVTFIDPDDFFDLRYFEEIDKFLLKNVDKNISLLACKLILYFEKNGTLKNDHALNYRFKKGNQIVPDNDLKGNIHLSAATGFFRTSIIKNNNLSFSELCQPYEDANFVGKYMLNLENTYIGFLSKAKYYYRKRNSGTSIIDNSLKLPYHYDETLNYGYLDLLKYAKEKNDSIPEHIQRMILYGLMWYFKYSINKPDTLNFLSSTQKKRYESLLFNIFEYIDVDTILNFNQFSFFWFYYKVGLIGRYKYDNPNIQIAYIDAYDMDKGMIRFRWFTCMDETILIKIDQEYIQSEHHKVRKHYFLDKLFVKESIHWIKINDNEQKLYIDIGNQISRLSLGGKHYLDGLKIEKIKNYFNVKSIDDSTFPINVRIIRRLARISRVTRHYQNAWLLIDRDVQSDDNAEHLYRYIMKNHPEINIFFVLRKDSHDWKRLKDTGFNLIDFGSLSHKLLILNADHIISSHADNYIMNFLSKKHYKDLLNFKYTFLQHGVTQNDLSQWLNSKNIACLVTTSPSEYEAISGSINKYKLTSKEVSLTGFPRHDMLLTPKHSTQKTILIMPTWRSTIVGPVIGEGNLREKNLKFSSTNYALAWRNLLHSKKLYELVKKYKYEICFFPHVNIELYLEEFDVPDYIKVLRHQDVAIQELFQKAALMITDYSSVAFEMGLLKKEVIYYQFDYDEVFNGGHIIKEGHFNYVHHGFGPVCYKETEVLYNLQTFMEQNGNVDAKYYKRMNDFFAFYDTKNSQRVFETIISLKKQD